MAKKRKTRQEKVIADLRRKLATQVTDQPKTVTSGLYSLPQQRLTSQPGLVTYNLKPNTSTYVLSDLKKTLILTAIALGAQIVLHFVLAR